jgi:large subunit ribosomal protein L22
MTGTKTNERPGTRAELRHVIVSPYKVREVLDLIRGLEVARAQDVLRFCGRGSAPMVAKLLGSAVANAEHNDGMVAEELYVSACYADEARTLKRWRARARGRYTRIRKRTSHITVIVSRLPEDQLVRVRARQTQEAAQRRARRVAGGRKARQPAGTEEVVDETPVVEDELVVEETPIVEEAVVEEEVVEASVGDELPNETTDTDSAPEEAVTQEEEQS